VSHIEFTLEHFC